MMAVDAQHGQHAQSHPPQLQHLCRVCKQTANTSNPNQRHEQRTCSVSCLKHKTVKIVNRVVRGMQLVCGLSKSKSLCWSEGFEGCAPLAWTIKSLYSPELSPCFRSIMRKPGARQVGLVLRYSVQLKPNQKTLP